MQHFSVSQVARRIGARPKDISDLFYQRRLDDQRCPIVAGRRLIPDDYISIVEKALQHWDEWLAKAPDLATWAQTRLVIRADGGTLNGWPASPPAKENAFRRRHD